MGRSRRVGSVALPTDIVVGPWAGEEWKLSEVDMGMVGSVAMGLPWKGRGRGSVCWVGSLGQIVGSCCGKEEAEDRSLGLIVGSCRGSCRGKEEAEDRSVGSDRWVLPWRRKVGGRSGGRKGLAVGKKWQRIGLLGVAVERERQRIRLRKRQRRARRNVGGRSGIRERERYS